MNPQVVIDDHGSSCWTNKIRRYDIRQISATDIIIDRKSSYYSNEDQQRHSSISGRMKGDLMIMMMIRYDDEEMVDSA